jgi:hypothetical protein
VKVLLRQFDNVELGKLTVGELRSILALHAPRDTRPFSGFSGGYNDTDAEFLRITLVSLGKRPRA